MYACSVSKEAWVSDLVVSNSEGGWSWNLLFHHGSQDWQTTTVYSFFKLIYSSMPRSEGDDKLVWRLTTSSVFDVRFFISNYLVLPLMPFLGSVYGILRCLNECISSYGQ